MIVFCTRRQTVGGVGRESEVEGSDEKESKMEEYRGWGGRRAGRRGRERGKWVGQSDWRRKNEERNWSKRGRTALVCVCVCVCRLRGDDIGSSEFLQQGYDEWPADTAVQPNANISIVYARAVCDSSFVLASAVFFFHTQQMAEQRRQQESANAFVMTTN